MRQCHKQGNTYTNDYTNIMTIMTILMNILYDRGHSLTGMFIIHINKSKKKKSEIKINPYSRGSAYIPLTINTLTH